jgi:membrane protein YdbS with pleckstrin-like domain
MKLLRPSSRYNIRLYVLITLAGIMILFTGIILAWVLSLDWAFAIQINGILQSFIFLVLLGYLLSIFFASRYYHSISYEFNLEEIKLQRGLWVQVVQHVPLSSIAGVTLKRDFFDRCLEIGSLEFLLYGSAHNKIGAICFVGLSDVEAQYRKISDLLLHYRGTSMQQSDSRSVGSHVVYAGAEINLQ